MAKFGHRRAFKKGFKMPKDLKLLGKKVRDKVTGFEGIVSSVGFDLYGCVQAVVTPVMAEKGKLEPGQWFDTKRLFVLDDSPVMTVPTFEKDKVIGGFQKSLPHG
jgi:hypothetical protein